MFSRHTPLTAGDAAVIDPNGKILLMQRADDCTWSLPAGGLEVGETPVDGVVREVLEETGVRCQAVALVGSSLVVNEHLVASEGILRSTAPSYQQRL